MPSALRMGRLAILGYIGKKTQLERIIQHGINYHKVGINLRTKGVMDIACKAPDQALLKHLAHFRGNTFGRGFRRECLVATRFNQSPMETCTTLAGIPSEDITKLLLSKQWTRLLNHFVGLK